MSDLLNAELANCATHRNKSRVQTCNSSNQSASELHLDRTATQFDQAVDTMILLIFVQRYRHLSYRVLSQSFWR